MSGLSFLKNAKVEETTVRKSGGGVRKDWNPNPLTLAIRVWRDGSVFPSQALVDKFSLEYRTATINKVEIPLKEGETEQKFKNEYYYVAGPGYGFDVIDSRSWPGYKGEGHMLFISPVAKDQPKVSLFASVGYEDDGTPKSSVMDQGTITFGKAYLLPMLQAVYGIELTEEKQFVDMVVFDEYDGVNIVEQFSRPITFLPKIVVSGADKGKPDLQRREGAKIYGFAPKELIFPQEDAIGHEAVAPEEGKEEEVPPALDPTTPTE